MRILIVVHLEPDFDLTGDLEILAKQVVRYSSTFDKVINITSAGGISGTLPFHCISSNFTDNREWIWGLDIDAYINEPDNPWIMGDNYISTNGHEYSEILDWMKELPKFAYYTIVGGARHECLQDIVDIWDYLGYRWHIKEELTY